MKWWRFCKRDRQPVCRVWGVEGRGGKYPAEALRRRGFFRGCIVGSCKASSVCLFFSMTENEIGTVVVDSAIAIHRGLGPGLLESVYEVVLGRVLVDRGLSVARQIQIPICYLDLRIDEGFRADMIVDEKVIIELKAVKDVLPVHLKQLQTYLRLADIRLGYLLNFNETLMKNGITRSVNRLKES
jgi:GxxExxY protein